MASDGAEYRPDTITVSAFAEGDIEATHADIGVVIRGASLFSGSAALKKAREVAALVSALEAIGIAEDAIELRSVHAEVVTGALGNKSSTATYTLRIRKVVLPQMADAIGVITAQRNTTLGGIVWQYGDENAARLRLLDAALAQAKAKAGRVAQALDVRLIGIHSLKETLADDEGSPHGGRMSTDYESRSSMQRARVSNEELGLAVTHQKHVTQRVKVAYRVSPLNNVG